MARWRQGKTKTRGLLAEKTVRNLNQHPGAIARGQVTAHGTPVQQVLQHFNAVGHNLVRCDAVNVGQEANPAIVMLIPGIIQPLRSRHSI